jgi:hypothetical protein
MNLLDSELWPFAAIVVIIVAALLGRWLRGEAVEDVHDRGEELSSIDEASPAGEEMAVGDGEEAELGEDELDDDGEDEDEVAPLGASPAERREFLERLAERGAIALIWVPADSQQQERVFQPEDEDGNVAMPVFTSEAKAARFVRALGPEAVANGSYDPFPVDAAFLVQGDFQVLVNPGTPFDTELTVADRRTLAALAGVDEELPDAKDPGFGDDADPETPPSDR